MILQYYLIIVYISRSCVDVRTTNTVHSRHLANDNVHNTQPNRPTASARAGGKTIGVILGGYKGYAYPPLFKVGGTVPPTFKRYKSGYFCLHLVT